MKLYLASIFSNQDWEMELVMELVLIRDEVGGRNIVVMCSDRINLHGKGEDWLQHILISLRYIQRI